MKILGRGLVAVAIVAFAVAMGSARAESAPPAAPFPAVVTANLLNMRSGPSTDYPIVGQLERGDEVDVVATVGGEVVLGGNATWFRLPSGRYIYSGFTRAGNGDTASSDGMSGRWIEVDRGDQVARAIQNGQVVYSAPVTVGTPSFPTPVGSFTITRRVANETMDSRTVGIPLSSPEGYYLPGVLYTQYITDDGVSLHYNYWSPSGAFGNYPGSHGCIGLLLADAKFFWDFADIGTPVIIRR